MEKQIYSYDEAYEESLRYFQGDELAARVWVNKYAVKDSFGNIYEKSPEDMHWRIANEVARIESKYPNGLTAKELYDLLDHFKYIVPQGSPMTGIGNDYQVASLSNCFVIGVDGAADSYGAIIKIDEEQVQLMKRRGGVGHDLSHIRPKGSPVKNSALTSTGLVPFMERYSNSTREVAQDGRRGALMLSVSIKHPDSEAFIDAKMTEGKVTGANVSVKLDDAFMQAAVEGKPYVQQYPIDAANPAFTKEIDASTLWKKIVHNAWKSAEPGVLIWETIIRESVPDCYADLGYKTVSTNPCGEIPLCPYDSCRLLAINLYSYVVNPFKPDAYFDFDLFKKHVALAQRIMDDIIDLELEKIERIMKKIDEDPENEEVKHAERALWEKIYKKSGQGRRTAVVRGAHGAAGGTRGDDRPLFRQDLRMDERRPAGRHEEEIQPCGPAQPDAAAHLRHCVGHFAALPGELAGVEVQGAAGGSAQAHRNSLQAVSRRNRHRLVGGAHHLARHPGGGRRSIRRYLERGGGLLEAHDG